MYCPFCGCQVNDRALKCFECGKFLTSFMEPERPARPENYLVHSILVTLLCCLPFGIPAIIFAAQVDGKYASGDYTGAAEASKNAYKWVQVAFYVGLVAVLTKLTVFLVVFLSQQ